MDSTLIGKVWDANIHALHKLKLDKPYICF